jgi:Ankyrin repeats (3 copies)
MVSFFDVEIEGDVFENKRLLFWQRRMTFSFVRVPRIENHPTIHPPTASYQQRENVYFIILHHSRSITNSTIRATCYYYTYCLHLVLIASFRPLFKNKILQVYLNVAAAAVAESDSNNNNMRDVDVNQRLIGAIKNGDTDEARRLLEQEGANVMVKTAYLNLLHIASTYGRDRVDVFNLLLEKEPALINTKDSFGMTALHFACRQGHVAIARLLLKKGADPTIKDSI